MIASARCAYQEMLRLTRRGDKWQRDNLGSFGFVPLVGGETE